LPPVAVGGGRVGARALVGLREPLVQGAPERFRKRDPRLSGLFLQGGGLAVGEVHADFFQGIVLLQILLLSTKIRRKPR
jgi:hypothetical protein